MLEPPRGPFYFRRNLRSTVLARTWGNYANRCLFSNGKLREWESNPRLDKATIIGIINPMPIKDPQKRKIRHAEYSKNVWYPKNRKKHIMAVARNRAKLKYWFRGLKSTLWCSKCNESSPACLDFHHVNKNEKIMEVCKMVSLSYSKQKILQEIDKCIVLCSNCHRKHHSMPVD